MVGRGGGEGVIFIGEATLGDVAGFFTGILAGGFLATILVIGFDSFCSITFGSCSSLAAGGSSSGSG